jgi:uncharacterized protein (TIGR03067 family)
MKTKLFAAMLLFGAWSVVATGQGADEQKALEKFKGTWKLVSEVDSGKNIPADPNEVFIFDGKKNCTNKCGLGIRDEFELKVNPTKTPKEIDLIPLKEPNKGIPSLAIYKLEGNKLSICINFNVGAKRPTAFECNESNRNIILIMEKVEK